MTVNEAIAGAVRVLGDTVPRETLISWLSEIESSVVLEISATHEGDTGDRALITPDGDGERVLFAPDPFSGLYLHYLLMKADWALRDNTQYMNSASQFSAAYSSFADHYNRENMPVQKSRIKL